MSNTVVKPSEFEKALAEILTEYGEKMVIASDSAVKAGADQMKEKLVDASPRTNAGGTHLYRSWRIKSKKYKDGAECTIYNTKMVKGRGGKEMALTDILEYSTVHGHPFVRQTYDANVDAVARVIADKIKEEAQNG